MDPGTDLAGGVGSTTPHPPIFLSSSVNWVLLVKTPFLVVCSNKLTPRFYLIYHLNISIYLLISSVEGGGKGAAAQKVGV